MAQLKIARTSIVALLFLCAVGGYMVHTLLICYAIKPHLKSLYTSDTTTTKQHLKQVKWSYPPGNDTHNDIQIGKATEESKRLAFGDDGLVRNWEDGQGIKGYSKRSSRVRHTHPIYCLIEDGQDKWAKLLQRQSKTLPQAVSEYKRRYGRPPPKGFEQWWQSARRNNIKIVDDYDQIHRDLEPFFALSPKLFQERRDQLSKEPHSYEIVLDPKGKSHAKGTRGSASRPQLLFGLLEPIAQYLPTKISFHGSDHDLGSTLLGDDQCQAAFSAIADKRYLSEKELRGYEDRIGKGVVKGTVAACPNGTLAWNQTLIKQERGYIPEVEPEATFIHSPSSTYDFCTNPSHLKTHGSFSFDFARSSVLRPLFQWSKQMRSADILTTPLEAYTNHTSLHAINKFAPWDKKVEDKVFWRGSSTGDAYTKNKNTDAPGGWRSSHRPRLALMAQAKEGVEKIWVKRGKEWRLEEWTKKRLNKEYMDIGMTGHPHQCNQEDGTCKEMESEINWLERVSPESAAQFEYAFDIDGNGWSSRFHRLIMSGSVVLKATIYPEWNSDWLIPWVHYVPVQVDYSDLYNIMSFFSGPPSHNGSQMIRDGGNDELAKAIAEAGRKFGEERWRWVDMQGYMFWLLLEYSRLLEDDRDAASYHRHRV